MTNKLLDKLLRGKIASLLMKYQTLQNAFHRIKTETVILFLYRVFTIHTNYNKSFSHIASYQRTSYRLFPFMKKNKRN